MPLQYSGPNKLREMFVELHSACAGDYERQDPKVAVSIPATFPFRGTFKGKGYGRQEDMDNDIGRYVNGMIVEIDFLKNTAHSKPKVVSEAYSKAANDLKKASFMLVQDHMATYNPFTDVLFIDPCAAALYYLLSNDGNTDNLHDFVNVPMQFRHELVHSDLGTGKAVCEIRQLYNEGIDIFMFGQELKRMESRGTKAVKHWKEKNGIRAIAEKLEKEYGITNPSQITEKTKSLFNDAVCIGETEITLGIQVVDEALAYHYWGGEDRFKAYTATEKVPEDIKPMAPDLYNALGRKIKKDGKLTTLKEVKTAIDTAFEQKRNVLEILL